MYNCGITQKWLELKQFSKNGYTENWTYENYNIYLGDNARWYEAKYLLRINMKFAYYMVSYHRIYYNQW